MTNTKAPTQRQRQVSLEIKRIIGDLLVRGNLMITGLKPSFLMITEVTISPDLSYAQIFIQGIGEVDTDEQLKILNIRKGTFRHEIGQKMHLRIVPDLLFKKDTSFEISQHIEDLLNTPHVKQDLTS